MGRSGYTCIRYLFCYINALIWIGGCGILGVGIWLRVSRPSYPVQIVPQYSLISGDNLLIVIGATVFIVTFFACCGSWFQSKCMLITYFCLVITVFLTELTIASLSFVYRENITLTLKDELKDGIQHHYDNIPPNGLFQLWDYFHTEFKCCGVDDYEDWYEINAWKGKRIVPQSCCLPIYLNNTTECWQEKNQDKWYQNGCLKSIQMWFVMQLHVVGMMGLFLTFLQLFGLISAMILFCTSTYRRNKSLLYSQY